MTDHQGTLSITEVSNGTLWVATGYSRNGRAALSSRSRGIRITQVDGLAGNEVKIMRRDQNGTYWLGTNKGLTRVDSRVVTG